MKIAVAYENGTVFPHFGKTEQFKVYEVDMEEEEILSSEVIGTDGAGHEALADFLANRGVQLVICGGLGDGAQQALAAAGIEVCSGASGDADTAVEAYMVGALVSAGSNCDHHDHDHEEGGCGGHCGGCHGCHSQPLYEGPNAGKICKVHYRGTFNDGTEFDSSYSRGEPMEFVCAMGMMIPGFDAAVAKMQVGETITIHLMPEEAYGQIDPSYIFTMQISDLPGSEELKAGERVALYDQSGHPVPVTVKERDESSITFDANHEMAGKELNFTIELISAE